MLENDPRYARQPVFGVSHIPGGTAPGRHDLARSEYLARRRGAPADAFGGRGR